MRMSRFSTSRLCAEVVDFSQLHAALRGEIAILALAGGQLRLRGKAARQPGNRAGEKNQRRPLHGFHDSTPFESHSGRRQSHFRRTKIGKVPTLIHPLVFIFPSNSGTSPTASC